MHFEAREPDVAAGGADPVRDTLRVGRGAGRSGHERRWAGERVCYDGRFILALRASTALLVLLPIVFFFSAPMARNASGSTKTAASHYSYGVNEPRRRPRAHGSMQHQHQWANDEVDEYICTSCRQ